MGLFQRQWSQIDDMVFEKRNKSYGAYILRKKYQNTLFKSFIAAVLIIGLLLVPTFLADLLTQKEYIEEVIEVEVVQLMEPPEFEMPIPPLEQQKNEDDQPVPEIKKDVPPETKPPELNKKVISNPNSKLAELFSKSDSDSVAIAKKDSVESIAEKQKKINAPLKIYVDALPDFPGGQNALFEFFKKNIVYPQAAKNNGIAGTVFVSFIVHANGKAGDAKIIAGLGAGCDEEVIRIIGLMPEWIPGRRFGSKIDFMYNIPVQFALK